MVGCQRLLDRRRQSLSVTTAAKVEIAEAASAGPMIPAGSLEPAAALGGNDGNRYDLFRYMV